MTRMSSPMAILSPFLALCLFQERCETLGRHSTFWRLACPSHATAPFTRLPDLIQNEVCPPVRHRFGSVRFLWCPQICVSCVPWHVCEVQRLSGLTL